MDSYVFRAIPLIHIHREKKNPNTSEKSKSDKRRLRKERNREGGIYLILIYSVILHLYAWLSVTTTQGCAETLLKNLTCNLY